MNNYLAIGAVAGAAALGGCSAQQVAASTTAVEALCTAYQNALLIDPALEKHNPTLVSEGTQACAVAPAVISSTSTLTAAPAPPAKAN